MRSQPLFHSIVHCSGPLRSSRRLLATTFPAVDDAVGFGASRRALSISSPRIARTLLHSSRYGRTLPTTIRDAPAIPAPDPVCPDLRFVQPPPQQMSWNSPATFPPARTVVLGVTLTICLPELSSFDHHRES